MENRVCDTKRELLFEENLEHFNKLWENAGKEAGVEKSRDNWFKCISEKAGGA